VGHSERRTLFGETDQDISEKVKLLQSLDIIPLICVGESLVQRNSGITQDVIADQILKSLELLDSNKPFILAYEPVWAIGTGKVATPELAEGAHVYIRYLLEKKINHEVASSTPILYGGSVTPENAKELIKQKNIDGFLVGGASLKVDSFLSIFNECLNVSN
jgi:triosephosphate isomerase